MNPQDPETIAHLTLEHYNQHAEEFWQGTRDHDVSQNIAALLQHILNEPPFKILDFGCGPGRDLKVFAELGHRRVKNALWWAMGAQRGCIIINKVGSGDSLTPAHACEVGKLSGLLTIVTLRRRRGCEVRATPLWSNGRRRSQPHKA